MLKRVRIKGYKSLRDVEAELPDLAVLLGPNAAGKSNFLDALQLLSKLGTSRTLKEAFDPPYRGRPLESFTLGEGGIEELVKRESLSFSIEADLSLSDAVVASVNREIREMRRPGGGGAPGKADRAPDGASSNATKERAPVRERDLRYRVEIEMLPKSGVLRVTDEELAALNSKGEPTRRREPFISRKDGNLLLRLEGQGHPIHYDLYLDHTILSMPHYPPHYPHLAAARRELERWLFFYFEPRERMRTANPLREVRHVGLMGEDLAAFLRTLQALEPRQFAGVEKSLGMLMPNVDGIELDVNALGEVELKLRENGIAVPAGVLSEGTLRLLGLLALDGVEEVPSLVGFEEPENGVHPGRIALIAELLKTRSGLKRSQYIVTTHSPILPDRLPDESLFVVRRDERRTRIDPLSAWGPLDRPREIGRALDDGEEPPVSERIIRGDFDA